ncbi:hypothetical protein FQZ97_1126160 [compost metagenome]
MMKDLNIFHLARYGGTSFSQLLGHALTKVRNECGHRCNYGLDRMVEAGAWGKLN